MAPAIVLTGGGTAGHVTPNFPIIDQLKAEGWQVDYIGSPTGVESDLIRQKQIPFHGIQSGKLRRYFSWKNFIDPFRILVGMLQSWRILGRLKPQVVFSKGGFVAFPVVFTAWLRRIPVIAHESDMSPGLANRLSFPFVKRICLTFEQAQRHFSNQAKIEVTGTPIRPQLLQGDRNRGLAFCGFDSQKPVLMILGGSLGAANINRCVRLALDSLLEKYQIIHLCGKDKVDQSLKDRPGYRQWEYVNEELPDLLAASDLVISRSGANSLYELLALAKPHILIPLSAKVSRGDQLQNARYFAGRGVSTVLDDDSLSPEILTEAIDTLMQQKAQRTKKIQALGIKSATPEIIRIIKEQAHV